MQCDRACAKAAIKDGFMVLRVNSLRLARLLSDEDLRSRLQFTSLELLAIVFGSKVSGGAIEDSSFQHLLTIFAC